MTGDLGVFEAIGDTGVTIGEIGKELGDISLGVADDISLGETLETPWTFRTWSENDPQYHSNMHYVEVN